MRTLIREENKITNPSELKKLDRYLRESFDLQNQNQRLKEEVEGLRLTREQVNTLKLLGQKIKEGKVVITE